MVRDSTRRSRTAYSKWVYAIQTQATMEQYVRHFKAFLNYVDIDPSNLEEGVNVLYERILEDKEWFSDVLMSYTVDEKSRFTKKEISTATLRNIHKPLKLFCDMNDILVNWRLIRRGLPPGKRYSHDRAPTIEEIHTILEYTDMRIKPIVLLMVSSGIRLGAWYYLKWKHVIPILNGNTIVGAKLIVYSGEPEQYFTFMTPEAYFALKSWMEFRSSYGESITGESWLMRDIWRTTSMTYGSRFGVAAAPKKLSHKAIRSMINKALYKQNIRTSPIKTHEFKAVHGFRKFFKTVCESNGMKPANVELLLGHDIGISSSYYKPTESQLLEDYLKVVNLLTVDKAFKLQEKLTAAQNESLLYRERYENIMDEVEKRFAEYSSRKQEH